MKKKNITLSVSHHIYLTEQERYALHYGSEINATGASIPVWFYRGTTSEPATEVFCNYTLVNNGDKQSVVQTTDEGYYINLPQIPSDYKPPQKIDNETWRKMSPEKQQAWYNANQRPLSSKRLLNYVDGGGKYLAWRQHDIVYKDKKVLLIQNFVEINDLLQLKHSLC